MSYSFKRRNHGNVFTVIVVIISWTVNNIESTVILCCIKKSIGKGNYRVFNKKKIVIEF